MVAGLIGGYGDLLGTWGLCWIIVRAGWMITLGEFIKDICLWMSVNMKHLYTGSLVNNVWHGARCVDIMEIILTYESSSVK